MTEQEISDLVEAAMKHVILTAVTLGIFAAYVHLRESAEQRRKHADLQSSLMQIRDVLQDIKLGKLGQ